MVPCVYYASFSVPQSLSLNNGDTSNSRVTLYQNFEFLLQLKIKLIRFISI